MLHLPLFIKIDDRTIVNIDHIVRIDEAPLITGYTNIALHLTTGKCILLYGSDAERFQEWFKARGGLRLDLTKPPTANTIYPVPSNFELEEGE